MLKYSCPLSAGAVQLQQFSLEENEVATFPGMGSRRCAHHHSGYECPDPHSGYDCPDPHSGYDCPDPHSGYDSPDRHSGYDCPDHHSGYSDPCSLQSTHTLRAVTAYQPEEPDRFGKQELESNRMLVPWPSLHVNMDTRTEEKPLTEKGLRSPVCITGRLDHLKCNILKAQMDAAFQGRKEEALDFRQSSSSQEQDNGRFPSSSLTLSQDSLSSSLTTDRRKRLVRQFSFNHSNEDDLPEALAAISSQSITARTTSESSLDKQIQPPIYPKADLPMLEGEGECCDRTLSPSKHSPFSEHPDPPLQSCETPPKSSTDVRGADPNREKLMRRLLMTEL